MPDWGCLGPGREDIGRYDSTHKRNRIDPWNHIFCYSSNTRFGFESLDSNSKYSWIYHDYGSDPGLHSAERDREGVAGSIV